MSINELSARTARGHGLDSRRGVAGLPVGLAGARRLQCRAVESEGLVPVALAEQVAVHRGWEADSVVKLVVGRRVAGGGVQVEALGVHPGDRLLRLGQAGHGR
jgi:hypothetical protein